MNSPAPRAPRPFAAIVIANLRRQSRDRTGLFFILIMPFVVITLVGFALGGRAGAQSFPVGVVVESQGANSSALLRSLEQAPNLEVRQLFGEEELSDGVRQGALAGGLVIPAALDGADLPATVSMQYVEPPGGQAGAAARSAVQAVVSAQAARLEALRAAQGAGASPQRADAIVNEASGLTRPITITSTGLAGAGALPTGFAYTSPANLVLFTFINSMAVAGALVETRRLGISRRALAAPVRPWTVLAAEALSRYLIAALQATLIVLGSSAIFGVRWGDPVAVLAVVALFCLVATAAAMLVGSALRQGSQAAAIGPPIGIVLGMLGGCLWPPDVGPPILATIGHLFPHAWAMDALLTLASTDGGITEVLRPLAVLLAMAAVLLAVSLALFRRSMVRTA